MTGISLVDVRWIAAQVTRPDRRLRALPSLRMFRRPHRGDIRDAL